MGGKLSHYNLGSGSDGAMNGGWVAVSVAVRMSVLRIARR